MAKASRERSSRINGLRRERMVDVDNRGCGSAPIDRMGSMIPPSVRVTSERQVINKEAVLTSCRGNLLHRSRRCIDLLAIYYSLPSSESMDKLGSVTKFLCDSDTTNAHGITTEFQVVSRGL